MLEIVDGVAKAAALKALRADVYQTLAGLVNDGSRRFLKPRLGLAISGGVDSMALATLCACYWHGVDRDLRQDVNFSGFIVDHGYRPESGDEARKVAEQLSRLGIEPRILKLDWSGHGGDPKTVPNFESAARRLRYQAIGKACYKDDIRSVLVAHHADDQAETVLARMHQKWYGHGLKGMKPVGKFPECEGIYGVDGSGEVRFPAAVSDSYNVKRKLHGMGVEGGGLRIHRPLLRYTKEDLVAICEELDVQWFEDQTNADKSLTLRNAIRHLQRQKDLPEPLQRARLVAMSDRILEDREAQDKIATELFESIPVTLDLVSGTASFTLRENVSTDAEAGRENHLIYALALRKLLLLVAPHSDISLADLDTGVDHVFSNVTTETTTTVQVAEVSIQRKPKPSNGTAEYLLKRANPTRHRKSDLNICWPKGRPSIQHSVSLRWSEWILWDSRYWIRVGHFGQNSLDASSRLSVTFLASEQLIRLKNSLDHTQRHVLHRCLRNVLFDARFTIPAIVIKKVRGEETSIGTGVAEEDVEVVGLPTISWSNPNFNFPEYDSKMRSKSKTNPTWIWEVRYREVDFCGPEHKFIDSAMWQDQTRQIKLEQKEEQKEEEQTPETSTENIAG